ncbi:MAG: hypothetical protein IJ514_04875 [Clostridia bacterium]|nr:hypothetical protein [Clostridia bacterium]
MVDNKLLYERLKVTIVVLDGEDVVRTSFVTNNAEDAEHDFFAPLFG